MYFACHSHRIKYVLLSAFSETWQEQKKRKIKPFIQLQQLGFGILKIVMSIILHVFLTQYFYDRNIS